MRQYRRNPPLINAPPVVTALALSLIAAHALRMLAGGRLDGFFANVGAVVPGQFWGWVGVAPGGVGDNALSALVPLFGTAFVHGSWSHLLMNSIMLVAVGKPVRDTLVRTLRDTRKGDAAFVAFFFISVIGGSIGHLVSHIPYGPAAIGASGGVSGFLAAVMLIQQGVGARILARPFLATSAVFLVANLMLAFLGPSMLGSEIAWQAHIGGYIAGAALFRYLGWRYRELRV